MARDSRGWSMINTTATAIKTGTITLKADAGRLSSNTAPVMPPSSDATPSGIARSSWLAGSRR
jgi:hypothetical protein